MQPFPPTRWSLILDAREDDPEAVAELCKVYWFPLYNYARHLGLSVDDAKDLTQAFFERLLTRDFFKTVRQSRGRLRSLLLVSMKNFATEQWRRDHAAKRGGGRVIEIDALSAEARRTIEETGAREVATPETEFDRSWAREVMRVAADRLRTAYAGAGTAATFDALAFQLDPAVAEKSYDAIATELGTNTANARLTAFKFRKRFRQALEDVVAETVTSHDELADELAYLTNVFQPASP